MALLLLALVVVGPLVASSYGSGQSAGSDAEAFAEAMEEGRAHTVAPHPNSTMAIWPYTSRSRSVEGATLPINVVVLEDVDLVRNMLIHRPDAHWEDQRHGLNGSTGNSSTSVTEPTPVGAERAGNATPAASTPAPNGTAAPRTTNGTAGTPTATMAAIPTADGTAGTAATNATVGPPTPGGTAAPANASATGANTANATAGAPTPTPNATTTRGASNEGPLFPTSINSTGVYWSDATGSNRYTYVRGDQQGSGRWIDEAGQLHDGDYFGTRYHIRFYRVPDGESSWTALQVHREHFDWFRLRHTVGSLPVAQHYVESQFYDQWYVADLHRERFTRGGILNADGWVTVVDVKYPDVLRRSFGVMSILAGLALVGAFGGWPSPVDRRDVRKVGRAIPVDARFVVLAVAVAVVPLFVRLGSLAVERTELVNSPHVVAGAFYPMLALGLPACAYLLARGVGRQKAFAAAAGGFGVGVLTDYAVLGITLLPVAVIVHRAILVLALGVVAVAGTDRPEGSWVAHRDPTLLVGGGLWVAGLLWTLFFW